MAISSREQLIEYCLRKLGWPVVKINIDPDQLSERIDDALQFFQEFHYDGLVKTYLKHEITAADISNRFLTVPPWVFSVSKVIPLINALNGPGTSSFFDLQYQIRMSDLFNLTSTQIMYYDIAMKHLSMLEYELNPYPIANYSRYENKLEINLDWGTINPGQFLIIEVLRTLDPAQASALWNDRFLKEYATALIKRQWATNLKKYSGVQLLGGISLDGNAMYAEAQQEVKDIENEIQNRFELPVDMVIA